MTAQNLKKIIQTGETFDIEFKGEEKGPLSDRDLVETVVCLANRPGQEPGYLLVGVEDDGRITGARSHSKTGNLDPLLVQALIANRTRPSLSCRVEIVNIGNKPVLVIEVPPSPTPIGTSEGMYVRRAIGGKGNPECLPFHFHEMQAQQANRGLLDYSALLLPQARQEELDPLEFERFRRLIRENRGDNALLTLPDTELAKALGAIGHDGIRVLALLLFGNQDAIFRHLPTHEVAFQVLAGTKVENNEFFHWPLLRLMEDLLTRFKARNREEEVQYGLLRIGIPDYSEIAFREALANALVHRDYSQLGAIYIQWHSDRLEISNPGGFPEGVNLHNFLVTPPKPRNPLLADAFKRAGLVERTARGIDSIFYEQLRNGRPAPSYQRSTQANVVLVIPGGKANLDFVRWIVEEQQAGKILGLDELLLLNHLWRERWITTEEASNLIQKSELEARAKLEELVETGLVEAKGEKRGRSYHFSAFLYRRLGKKEAYIRQRGFEPMQQEQMILQFIASHKKITRREAAELCRLGPFQASRLLQKLTKQGKLKKLGQGKGTWYELIKI